MKTEEEGSEMNTQETKRDPLHGFWVPKRQERVFATVASYGFRDRYWTEGEMTVVQPGEMVPHHFHLVDEMSSASRDVPPFGRTPVSAFNAHAEY